MVEAQTYMAAANETDGKRKLLGDLKKEFPELPEEVISDKLEKHPRNIQLCIHELQEESNISLYGGGEDITDSPWPVNPSAPTPPTRPLSISIPNSTVHYNAQFASQPPMVRPMTAAQPSSSAVTMTAAQPSSSAVTMTVSGDTDRQPLAEYQQAILQHQYQRLHRLMKDLRSDKFKLNDTRRTVQAEEQEIVIKKYRVAANPTLRDVKLLEDENSVLVQEISEMTQEIDKLGGPFDEVEVPQGSFVPLGNLYSTSPSTLCHLPPTSGSASPAPRHPLPHRSTSYPQGTPHNGRPSSLCSVLSMLHSPQNPPPTTDEIPFSEGSRDSSLENNDWIMVQQQNQDVAEENWTCGKCTFKNHPALNTCEICSGRRS